MKFDKNQKNFIKPVTEKPDHIFNGFEEWLESEDAEEAMQAMDDVNEFLIDASVDIKERKIIWFDDAKLSITQSAERIKQHSEVSLDLIKLHVIIWLQMEYVPDNLTEKQMEHFEIQIEEWIEDYKDEA